MYIINDEKKFVDFYSNFQILPCKHIHKEDAHCKRYKGKQLLIVDINLSTRNAKKTLPGVDGFAKKMLSIVCTQQLTSVSFQCEYFWESTLELLRTVGLKKIGLMTGISVLLSDFEQKKHTIFLHIKTTKEKHPL